MNARDLRLRQKLQQDKKADARARYRAVLCASDGSRTTGSVWADEDFKLVYFQFFGSGGVGIARCQKLEPQLGLGVYVGKTDDGLEWQVLEDDPLLRRTATDPRGYQSVAARDFEPGGRLQLWLYTKLIVPLAVYDTPGTLQISVVAGDYPYLGSRKTFTGQTGLDLTSHVPGNPGETRYVGVYLDSSNALQLVDGAAGATPTEPTWPAGAFWLAVVQLDNGQTSISFADDIFDRRMVWSSELDSAVTVRKNSGANVGTRPRLNLIEGANITLTVTDDAVNSEVDITITGGGGWPFDKIKSVSSVDAEADYASLTDALTAAVDGWEIMLDAETLTAPNVAGGEAVADAVAIIGFAPEKSILTRADDSSTVMTVSDTPVTLRDFTIRHTGGSGAGTSNNLVNSQADLVLDNVHITHTAGTDGNHIGLSQSAGDSWLKDCVVNISGGTVLNYAIYLHTAGSTCVIEGGEIVAGNIVTAHASAVIELRGVKLASGVTIDVSGGGVVKGHYIDSDGNVITLERIDEAEWIDFPLIDSGNSSGVTTHLRDNTATYPAGWTEADAANSVNTNRLYSFWYLQGASTETSWKYRKKSSINLESLSASSYASFMFGPLLWRDANYTADLHWRLGIYRDNAGAIDEQTYVRVDFYWNQASGIWQYRLEEKDGTTAHTSSYLTLDSQPLPQGRLWFRVNVQNAATKPVRGHVGATPIPLAHTLFATQTPSSAPTWGDIWVQIELTRGAGVTDALFIGAVDYSNDA